MMLFRGAAYRVLLLSVQAVTFALLPVIARMLGPEAFSIWSLSYAFVQLLAPCIMLQLDSAFVRFNAGAQDKDQVIGQFASLTNFICRVSAIALGIAAFLPAQIGTVFFGSGTEDAVVLIAAAWAVSRTLALLCRTYYRTRTEFGMDFALAAFQQIALCSGVLIASFVTQDVLSVIICAIAADLCVAGLSYMKIVGCAARLQERTSIPISYLSYSLPLVLVGILSWGVDYSDQVIIVHLLGHESNARYAIYYMFARLAHWSIVTPINYAFFPIISKIEYAGEGKTAVHSRIRWLLSFVAYMISVFIVGLICFGLEVIEFISGVTPTNEGLSVVFIVGLSVYCSAAYQIIYQILSLKNQTSRVAITFAAGLMINLCGNLLLIPLFGIVGASASTLLAYAAIAVLCVRFSEAPLGDLITVSRHILLVVVVGATYLGKLTLGFAELGSAAFLCGGAVGLIALIARQDLRKFSAGKLAGVF